jgi:CheY-like chemotaxis protein
LKTLVVADDDPDYCYFVGVLLGPMVDTVTIVGEAGSGEEALALVLRKKPDIVVADLLMPRVNGIELTRRIKRELPDTKIILMSAYPTDANKRLALVGGDPGCGDRLTEPLVPSLPLCRTQGTSLALSASTPAVENSAAAENYPGEPSHESRAAHGIAVSRSRNRDGRNEGL